MKQVGLDLILGCSVRRTAILIIWLFLLFQCQQDKIDKIEDNIDQAHADVQQGTFHLGKVGVAIFEPAHAIMVLFIFRKLFLQMRMRSHPMGLDV